MKKKKLKKKNEHQCNDIVKILTNLFFVVPHFSRNFVKERMRPFFFSFLVGILKKNVSV